MNEQNRKQIIIAAVLGTVLVGVLGYQLFFSKAPPPPSDPDNAKQQATAAKRAPRAASEKTESAPLTLMAEITLDEIKAMSETVDVKPIDYARERIARNPMAPLVGALGNPPSPIEGEGGESAVLKRVAIDTTSMKKINGIVFDKRFPVAVVDDTVVHVGYVFPNGAQVHAIEPTRVLFKVGETIIPVEMKEH